MTLPVELVLKVQETEMTPRERRQEVDTQTSFQFSSYFWTVFPLGDAEGFQLPKEPVKSHLMRSFQPCRAES